MPTRPRMRGHPSNNDPVKRFTAPVDARPGTRNGFPSLKSCQVCTPLPLVQRLWRLVLERRPHVTRAIDIGAGDGRFSRYGKFGSYLAVEIDRSRIPAEPPRKHVLFQNGCAFDVRGEFDLVLGNPPYIRQQDLSSAWRTKATRRLYAELGVVPDGRSNSYLYFLWLALALARHDGLCAMVVPSDWLWRPAAASFRAYLRKQRWGIDVYDLDGQRGVLFETKVQTTASFTLIDKARRDATFRLLVPSTRGGWQTRSRRVDTDTCLLSYESRKTEVFACRGFSSGSQPTFVLTENERRAAGIQRRECVPSIGSLRHIPSEWRELTTARFESAYVRSGRRCWLLRTDRDPLSPAVAAWLTAAPLGVKQNWTCRKRAPWYRYEVPRIPELLYSSAFHSSRPKALLNTAGVRCVGTVHGVFGPHPLPRSRELLRHLGKLDLRGRVARHSGGMRKIDVRQMNGLLSRFYADGSVGR